MKKIISIVGARPNFMKAAPIHKALKKHCDKIVHKICHTGQHYDEKMSKIFFEELDLPHPDFYLGVGSGSHAEQTAKVMIAFENIVFQEKPDLVIVFGDVNSTVACSMVCAKLGVKIAHVEAGLRSFDREMPEEINRIVTDVLSDYLFVTEQSGMQNLSNEGISSDKVFFVGNVMIDSVVHYLPQIENSSILSQLKIDKNDFILVTLHRPSNVDSKESLAEVLSTLNVLSHRNPIVFPVHPRTKKNIEKFGLGELLGKKIILTDPIGYIDFLALTKYSKLIITDSGGIQEESTFLNVQCLTTRENTERPVTVDVGTNRLLGSDWKKILNESLGILDGNIKTGKIPELWDGKASDRIVDMLISKLF